MWLEDGHELLGRRVLRSFDGAPSVLGIIASWLPAGSADNEDALFKAVHADGDSEELEEYEVHEGSSAYEALGRPRAKGSAGGLEQPLYVNELRANTASGSGGGGGEQRLFANGNGLSAARAELGSLELLMAPGLQRADPQWSVGSKAKATGERKAWLKGCKEAGTARDLAVLLVQLEGLVYSLQAHGPHTILPPTRPLTRPLPPPLPLTLTLTAPTPPLAPRAADGGGPGREAAVAHVQRMDRGGRAALLPVGGGLIRPPPV